jgi:hypothetical protein
MPQVARVEESKSDVAQRTKHAAPSPSTLPAGIVISAPTYIRGVFGEAEADTSISQSMEALMLTAPQLGNVTAPYVPGSTNVIRFSDPTFSESFILGELPRGQSNCAFKVDAWEGSKVLFVASKAMNAMLEPAGVAIVAPQLEIAIGEAVERISRSSGEAKVRARDRAVLLLMRAGRLAVHAHRAVSIILASHRSGFLDDAIDLLSSLGPDLVINLCIETRSMNADYLYVLIRAAGRTGTREVAMRYIDSPILELQEAALEALSDLDDTETLTRIANNPGKSEFIRQLAGELASE